MHPCHDIQSSGTPAWKEATGAHGCRNLAIGLYQLYQVYLSKVAKFAACEEAFMFSIFMQCFQISKRSLLLEGSQASPVCPSGKSNMYMKMSMEHWWNDTDRGN
jgi:hypothetical protein